MKPEKRRMVSLALSAISVIGLVGTAVSAALDSKEAEKAKRSKEIELKRSLTKEEEIKVKAPKYIRTVAFGLCTGASIIGAAVLDEKNYKSLAPFAAAYPILEERYYKFRETTKTVAGEETYKRIMDEISFQERANEEIWVPGLAGIHQTVEHNTEQPEVKRVVYDVYSEQTIKMSLADLINAQYHFNRNVQLGLYPSVLNYYDMLGFDITRPEFRKFDGLSWNGLYDDGIFWIDFNNPFYVLEDGSEIIRSGFVWDPEPDGDALMDWEDYLS